MVRTQIISRSLVVGSSSLAGKDFIKGLAALNMGGDDRTEMENREGILLVKEMVEQQKVRTRELALDSLMSKYEKKPSTKRALRFVKKLQYFLEDVSELLALDGDGKFVNNDTVGEANLVIKKVHSLMRDVKVEVQKEYDDVVMAAHSELGWKTVNQFRGDFGIPEDISQEIKDLRKYEKQALTLAKEKRAAVTGARGSFSYSNRGRYLLVEEEAGNLILTLLVEEPQLLMVVRLVIIPSASARRYIIKSELCDDLIFI